MCRPEPVDYRVSQAHIGVRRDPFVAAVPHEVGRPIGVVHIRVSDIEPVLSDAPWLVAVILGIVRIGTRCTPGRGVFAVKGVAHLLRDPPLAILGRRDVPVAASADRCLRAARDERYADGRPVAAVIEVFEDRQQPAWTFEARPASASRRSQALVEVDLEAVLELEPADWIRPQHSRECPRNQGRSAPGGPCPRRCSEPGRRGRGKSGQARISRTAEA